MLNFRGVVTMVFLKIASRLLFSQMGKLVTKIIPTKSQQNTFFDTHKIVFALRIIGPYKNGYFEGLYTPGIQVQTLPIGGPVIL